MIVVSDTSPMLNLAATNKLHLLGDLYGEIVIPPAVEQELERNGVRSTSLRVRVFAAQNQDEVDSVRYQLDPGDAEAIVIAGELGAGLLMVDERRGRRIATHRGLEVTGLLSVLAEAKSRGLISRCKPILDI